MKDRLSIISGLLVGAIALIAFILSFDAIMNLAIDNGVNPWLAWMVPLIVDGAMVVFSVSVMRSTLAGEKTWQGWLLIVAFTAVSVWFNIAHSNLTVFGIAIAALAPLALFATFETLMSQIRSTVQGGVNALAKHWRKRAKQVMSIAKGWRERAKELAAKLDDVQTTNEGLMSRIDVLQEKVSEAQNLKTENGRMQKEIARLTKEAELMQEAYEAWQHMNAKAQTAALYNMGKFGNLQEAASVAGVSESTVSRLAGQLNGLTKE